MKNILVVEDDPSTLYMLEYYLSNELGHKVDVANSINSALRMLERKTYDVCLFDYFMEKGSTCAPLVKAAKKGSKIVIMTAASIKFEWLKKETGADFVISKPFSLEKLDEAVNI